MSVELPRDAEGREIPLDTECLYSHGGEKQDVLSFTYYRRKDRWEIETDTRFINSINFCLTPPDGWENLLEDLSEAGDARYREAWPTSTETKTKMAVHRAPVARTAALELPCATLPTASAS